VSIDTLSRDTFPFSMSTLPGWWLAAIELL
jgi:hypothetical protein